MAIDCQFGEIPFSPSLIDHSYGENVHILSDPFYLSLLAKFSSEESKLPLINHKLEILYQGLMTQVVNVVFPRKMQKIETRMSKFHEEGVFEGNIIDLDTKVISVAMARAGTQPSQQCYHFLSYLLNPENLRQDHFYLNRKVNEKEEVIGIDVSGSKIGGGKDNAIVLFPDPMAATGGSLCHVIDHYKKEVKGQEKAFVAMHLIVTPEYVQTLKKHHPDVHIFAFRLDRGLSSSKALNSRPGDLIEEEKGLNEKQYIVPGAGGIGELLNNSFV